MPTIASPRAAATGALTLSLAVFAMLSAVLAMLPFALRPVAAQSTDPETIHRAFVDAVNRGDLDTAVMLLTDDAVLSGTPGCPPPDGCTGIAVIRQDLARGVAAHVQYTTLSAQVSGSTIAGQFETSGGPVAAAGVDRVLLSYTVELRDDRIAAVRGVFDTNDPQTARFLAVLEASALQGSGAQGQQVQAPAR